MEGQNGTWPFFALLLLIKISNERKDVEMATLRELLEKDGYGTCSNTGVYIHNTAYGDMAVSHRYLAGGWGDVLNSEAEKLSEREYKICR